MTKIIYLICICIHFCFLQEQKKKHSCVAAHRRKTKIMVFFNNLLKSYFFTFFLIYSNKYHCKWSISTAFGDLFHNCLHFFHTWCIYKIMISLKEENTTVFDPLTIFTLLIQLDNWVLFLYYFFLTWQFVTSNFVLKLKIQLM